MIYLFLYKFLQVYFKVCLYVVSFFLCSKQLFPGDCFGKRTRDIIKSPLEQIKRIDIADKNNTIQFTHGRRVTIESDQDENYQVRFLPVYN